MTYNTPVLTDRVPYTWDELKAHAVEANPSHRTVRPAPREVPATAFAGMNVQAQGAALKPLGEANTVQAARPAPVQAPVMKAPEVQPAAQSVSQAAPVQKPLAPAAAAYVMDTKLVDEIVQAVVPLIMERLHAQVSIMVDMTMKQAASKIRNDFDNALKMTVQSAVQKVVEDKLSH